MNRIEHNESKWLFPFVEYSPASGKNEKLPLIIQLHGAGERGNGGDDLWRVEDYKFIKTIKDSDYNCIFVMPQCPTGTFWVAHVESIIKFIEQVKSEYNVDENRVYLTGLSMGGYGTWYTALAAPSLFAAIAPICGGGMPWCASALNMPVWAFHGADDTVVSPMHSEEMVAKLRELGREVKYSRFDGVAHCSWDNAHDEGLVEWLLSKSKQ